MANILNINFLLFLSAPISGDHENLQILSIMFDEPDLDLDRRDVMDMIRLLGIRFIKNWVTTLGSTEMTYERIFSESFGKSLEEMDSLLSSSLHDAELPRDIFLAHARHLQKLCSLYLEGSFKQEQLSDSTQLSLNLTKLILEGSMLEHISESIERIFCGT